ncbi:COX6A-domain-containing protein [Lindgomyces ingoldianus]|uniref:COX6A-domain-containing protein n=1 Tax=Lindgomyces ingoldianus TaxID=673940 RepID=A0ACB6RDU9_9PLEO|nr:COX6A-domain-containing protein [Lindgomyces ingoldianus]KAF2477311.1 COX6A-domain-containing protein [Lindgomyces ingoldianus]
MSARAAMFPQRVLFRSTQRLGLARTAFRRRQYSSEAPKQFTGAEDNEFNRERARIQEHAAESGEFWRKLTLFVAVPALIIASVNAKLRWDAHWEHKAHEPPIEEKPEYSYQNIRTKNFWWGDGDKTLFWNDKVNYHKKDE